MPSGPSRTPSTLFQIKNTLEQIEYDPLILHCPTASTLLMPHFIIVFVKIRAHKCPPLSAITNGSRSVHRGPHPFVHRPIPATLVRPSPRSMPIANSEGSSIPPLWPFLALYLLWVAIDGAPERGGRRSEWVRRWRLWDYYADYYPCSCVPLLCNILFKVMSCLWLNGQD